MPIEVPSRLAAYHLQFYRETGAEWIANLPALAGSYLERWQLTLDGQVMHGMVGLVLPVRRHDGAAAVLKLSPIDPEHLGEGIALRAWAGQGSVLLLDEQEEQNTSIFLLERLHSDRALIAEPDLALAVQIIAELLARLNAHQAPAGIRSLNEVVAKMLACVPEAETKLEDPGERWLLRGWAARVSEVAGSAGDRLLHWDLHYENVLAGEREPWLAIDPKPLAGDPGFELLPALHNRWEEAVATGDVTAAVLRRFDQMTEVLGLDRQAAVTWSLARVLQNSLWSVQDGDTRLDPIQVAIARALAP